MAFTISQLTAFFTNRPQMGLTVAMRTRLAAEGLQDVDDFKDFREDQIDDAIKNLRTAIPGVKCVVFRRTENSYLRNKVRYRKIYRFFFFLRT